MCANPSSGPRPDLLPATASSVVVLSARSAWKAIDSLIAQPKSRREQCGAGCSCIGAPWTNREIGAGFDAELGRRYEAADRCHPVGPELMRLLIALLLPWLAFFTIGRPIVGIACLILQITLIGWIPPAFSAAYAASEFHTDRRLSGPREKAGYADLLLPTPSIMAQLQRHIRWRRWRQTRRMFQKYGAVPSTIPTRFLR